MCGRYQVMTEDGTLRDVFPSEAMEVLTVQGVQEMRWGFTVPGVKRLLINARSESAEDKLTFQGLMRTQRCLIPADGFYEWDTQKQPHTYRERQGHKMYFAGLYRQEEDGRSSPGPPIPLLQPYIPACPACWAARNTATCGCTATLLPPCCWGWITMRWRKARDMIEDSFGPSRLSGGLRSP